MAANIHVIKVPDVGEGIAEVELIQWHVAPGDAVAEDQVLASVMTDKANVDIPSPVAGTVVELGGEVGKMLAVGSALIRIDKGGAGAADGAGARAPAREPATSSAPAPAKAEPAATAPARVPASATAGASAGPTPAPSPVAGPPPAPPATAAPVPAPVARATDQSQSAVTERPIASPAVRRRAWELGIDLKDVTPGGTAGRIMQSDLDAALAAGVARAEPPAAERLPAQPSSTARGDGVQTIPLIGLRRAIATRMQEAKRHIPHFSYVEELDVTEAEALRAALNHKWAETRGRLTLLPLLMRALVLAVRDFPQVNAWFDDEAGVISRHAAVHLGVATQTPQGLLVPVVRHAEALDVWGMAAEVARLAEAARTGRAAREQLMGSTITISSLGALGGIVSTPVINRPEVAIVAVNRIVERPLLRAGDIVARKTMNLSSSFDHRVVDGDDAARFVQAVRTLIETPGLLFAA
jgi:2-oxoisovalerate dehydrogenase E2 component (dihydrolipoyl transacylase)